MAEEFDGTTDACYKEKILNTVQDVNIPNITSAHVCNVSKDGNHFVIATKWTQKNYEVNNLDEFSVLYDYEKSENKLEKINFPLESKNVLIEAISPSLKQRVVVKKHCNETTKKEEFILEVWSNSLSKRLKTINLTSLDKHGPVHSSMLFGLLCWSEDETKVLYVAEKKKPKATGFFEKIQIKPEGEQPLQGGKYEYEENWGEQLTGVTNTVLCVLSLIDENIQIVQGIPENISPLQPQFGPDNTIVFVGFQNTPFRLGAVYCENQVAGLYLLKLEIGAHAIEITKCSGLTSNYRPYLNKSNTKCVFLQKKLSGNGDPHMNCFSLMVYDFHRKSVNLLCDQLNHGDQTFPLFIIAASLKYNYWLSDDIHIVIPVICEGRNYVCCIDTANGMTKSMLECTNVFGIHKDVLLTSYEKLNAKTSTLMIINCDNPANLIAAKEPQQIDDDVESDSFADENGIISFYLMPKRSLSPNHRFPLFVFVHGGPHVLFTNDFNRYARLFCKLGYAVLLVNYRGSLGFTEESLKSLLGNIGTQDVSDVQKIVHHFIDLKNDKIDMDNKFVCGGSHGGFIGLHLIGQYPDFYQAAALRNPVVEISSMSTISDIPDWTYVESGLSYAQDLIPTNDVIKSMLSKSPIIHVGNIKAPLLLCIGDQDARVPPSQGKYLFRLLKAKNKVVKMLLYPNDWHSLSNVETDGDHIINICKWFYQFGTHSK